MKKSILIICVILVILTIIVAISLINITLWYFLGASYKGLEFVIPIFCKRDVTTLSKVDFFDEEKLEKIYLSKLQAKIILNKIDNNNNWIKGEIDEKVEDRLKFYTREDIYNQIPYIENKYWIFTNRSNGAKDKHSIDEVINTMYYSISFGLYDIDNEILYYYEYER